MVYFYFHTQTAIFDTQVIDPCCKSYVKAGQRALGTAAISEKRKCELAVVVKGNYFFLLFLKLMDLVLNVEI